MQVFGWILFLCGSFALGWSCYEPVAATLAVPATIAGAVLAAGGAIAAQLAAAPQREVRELVPAGPMSVCALDGMLASFEPDSATVVDCSDRERQVLEATVSLLTDGARSWEDLPEAMQRRWLNTLQNYPGGAALDPANETQVAAFAAYATGKRG